MLRFWKPWKDVHDPTTRALLPFDALKTLSHCASHVDTHSTGAPLPRCPVSNSHEPCATGPSTTTQIGYLRLGLFARGLALTGILGSLWANPAPTVYATDQCTYAADRYETPEYAQYAVISQTFAIN
jgi:hypothetical protein